VFQAISSTHGTPDAIGVPSRKIRKRAGRPPLLLTYKDAVDLEVNHEDPGGTLIDVPDDKGQVAAKPFGECTVDFPQGVRVKVLVRNEKGKAVLDFKGIPVEQVSQLAAALRGELPPVREVRLLEKPAVG
jgi:hypothetical protein